MHASPLFRGETHDDYAGFLDAWMVDVAKAKAATARACDNCGKPAEHETARDVPLCQTCAREGEEAYWARCARCGEWCEAPFDLYWEETAYCSPECSQRDSRAFEAKDPLG